MCWALFLLLVSRIEMVEARRLLQIMDGTLYGAGKPQAAKSDQMKFDMFRQLIDRAAHPKVE
jgi:hypothetical protein